MAKTVKTGTTTNYIQHYAQGIEYNSASGLNRRVEAIYHGEGRFFNTNTGTTNPTYRTEYSIKDHLDDRPVLTARQKSSATKALDREGTATNRIAASTKSLVDRQIFAKTSPQIFHKEGTATNRIAASTKALGDRRIFSRTSPQIFHKEGTATNRIAATIDALGEGQIFVGLLIK